MGGAWFPWAPARDHYAINRSWKFNSRLMLHAITFHLAKRRGMGLTLPPGGAGMSPDIQYGSTRQSSCNRKGMRGWLATRIGEFSLLVIKVSCNQIRMHVHVMGCIG